MLHAIPAKHKRPRKSSPARISALLLQADEMTDERSEMKNIPAVQKAAAICKARNGARELLYASKIQFERENRRSANPV